MLCQASRNSRACLETDLAKQTAETNGKRMVQTLITEAHNRLRIYQQKLDKHRSHVLNETNHKDTQQLIEAIQYTTRYYRSKRQNELETKLKNTRCYRQYNHDEKRWVKNLSKRPLTDDETRVLAKGINFNTQDLTD